MTFLKLSKMRASLLCCVLLSALIACSPIMADEPEQVQVDFAREVLPILSNKCFVCHGPDAEEGMLRLDSYELAIEDRGGYHAIVPSSAEDQGLQHSELLKRIQSSDDPMPPADAEQELTDKERSVLSNWVRQGGEYNLHWAFELPQKSVPEGSADAGPNGTIDAFIREKLVENHIELAPIAERSVLARRAALTLTGLPPERELLRTFMEDRQADAFGRYVDQLLESDKFGEHQARYWLDAVRYGDTHGLHLDNRRGIYPYRDWVIQAFNKNLPLDEFITWQLAGDLLPDPTLEQRVATGFVRMNPSTAEGGVIPEEFQAKNNFDRTETFGTVFLGMTFTCARCHTHKYDPIPHVEYYKLFAFFNSTQESPLDGNKYDYAPTIRAPRDIDAWRNLDELNKKRQELLLESRKQLEEMNSAVDDSLQKLPTAAVDQQEDLLVSLSASLASLQSQIKQIDSLRKQFTTTLVAGELDKPRVTQVLARGEYDQRIGEPLMPDVPAAVSPFPADAPRNRLGLARWLTARDNPLVSRVLVNRMWQQVFGYGLVRTPEDFGLQGQQPTHPELLDWLAVELQDSGWDMKHMLRIMVLSDTFQQTSAWRSEVDDPENRLFARGPSYRLDAEVLRDIGLWASGLLDPKMGGEGVKPYQPDGMWAALAHPASNTKKYERDAGEKLYRRSIYVYWKRTSPHPMMTLFDAPSRESSCVRRSRTNTSLQSLGLLNETQRIEMARKFAERLLTEAESDRERTDLMFQRLVCRSPAEGERETAMNLLNSMRERFRLAQDDAAALLATGDAPVDQGLETVEVAAWTQVAATLLASDMSIMLY